MEQTEIDSLTAYLAGLFGKPELTVLQHPEADDEALVAVGQEFFARIQRDEDEGELSYSFSKDLPDQPYDELNEHVQGLFTAGNVQVRKRPNKTDSMEVYKGEEFLGVIYDDDDNEDGVLVFNMAILDIDLESDAA